MAKIKVTDPDKINPSHMYVGVRKFDQNGGTSYQYYHGATEESVLHAMCQAFAAEAIDKMSAASALQQHLDIRAVLKNLRFSPERAEEVANEIREARPKDLEPFSNYFTYAEIIRAYLRLNKDERIEVVEYRPHAVTTFATVKPAQIDVVYYDHTNRMAIAKNGLQLIGYYQLERVGHPHPDDYEWDNGFDLEFISPDQAAALKRRGFDEIVDCFEAIDAICEG